MRVVGVAPDLVYEEFGEETPQSQLMVYVPTARAPWRTHALLLRSSSDPSTLAAAVRNAARDIDPDFAVFDVMTMTARRGHNHWGERFMGQTTSAFAVVALLLACVGIYSITTYAVAQRRREIGVRLALGAQPSQVTQLFWRMTGRVVVLGACGGVCLAVLVARVLQQRLFRTSAWEPATWLVDGALLATSVAVAAYLPARRASRVDPVASLRGE
jgi:putative ABC transport system permease protein